MMVSKHPEAAPPADWPLARRLALPAVMLVLFGALALLWEGGPHQLYFDALRLLGVEPFRFPFLDIHAVLV